MVRDVVSFGVLGAVIFLFLCGIVLMDDGSLLPRSVAGYSRSAFYFVASPWGTPPPGLEAELVPQGLILAFLASAIIGFFVHLIRS